MRRLADLNLRKFAYIRGGQSPHGRTLARLRSGRPVRLLVDSSGRLIMKVGYPQDAHCWTKTE